MSTRSARIPRSAQAPESTLGNESALGRRAILRAGAVAGVALGTAACARIPDTSPVRATPIGSEADPAAPFIDARPPRPGASPEEIVSSFIHAGVGASGDFSAARMYLTPEARETWDPLASVTVFSGDKEFEVDTVRDSGVRLTISALARIDARGSRTLLDAPESHAYEVALKKDSGEWRIDSPPPGIFLSEASFGILFSAVELVFADPTWTTVVTDPRWVLAQDSVPRVLGILEQGPREYLGEAVRTAVPRSAGLRAVTASAGGSGTADIDVPPSIWELPPQRRGRALAQILGTAQSLSSIVDVRLQHGDTSIDLSDLPQLARPQPGHRPIGAGPVGVIPLVGRATQLVPALAQTKVADPALSISSPLAVARSLDGSVIHIASTDDSIPHRQVRVTPDSPPPSVDAHGYAWTTAATKSGALLALSSSRDEEDVTLKAPWLTGRSVRWLAVAPDSTRLIVVSTADGLPRAQLSAIIRDDQGAPTGLTDPTRLPMAMSDIQQVTWYSENGFLALGAMSDGSLLGRIVDLLGATQNTPTPPQGTVRLGGTATAGMVLASTASGGMLRSAGGGWSDMGIEARDPSFC